MGEGAGAIVSGVVVRVLGLCMLGMALFGCARSRASEPGESNGGSEASGGSAGSVASGTGGPSCTPASGAVNPFAPGIQARIDGSMNHFMRDVEGYLGPHDPDGAFGFSVTAQKEPSICGQLNLTLVVIPGSDELGVRTYECAAVEPHLASGTHIVTLGEVMGLSYAGGECTIELTEVGMGPGDEVAGTFSGVLGGTDGELVVTDGRFRVTLTE
jgi:hypothetical protein